MRGNTGRQLFGCAAWQWLWKLTILWYSKYYNIQKIIKLKNNYCDCFRLCSPEALCETPLLHLMRNPQQSSKKQIPTSQKRQNPTTKIQTNTEQGEIIIYSNWNLKSIPGWIFEILAFLVFNVETFTSDRCLLYTSCLCCFLWALLFHKPLVYSSYWPIVWVLWILDHQDYLQDLTPWEGRWGGMLNLIYHKKGEVGKS